MLYWRLELPLLALASVGLTLPAELQRAAFWLSLALAYKAGQLAVEGSATGCLREIVG